MRSRLAVVATCAVIVLVMSGVSGCSTTSSTSNNGSVSAPVPDAEGQQLVEAKCTGCHSIERVNEASKSQEEWRVTVDRMVLNGLKATEDEKTKIVGYLTARDAAR